MSGNRETAKPQPGHAEKGIAPASAALVIRGSLHRYLKGGSHAPLERALSSYIPRCRWFRSKARNVADVRVAGAMPVGRGESCLTLVEVEFAEGEPELYVVPLAIMSGERAREFHMREPDRIIASVTTKRSGDEEKILCDAVADLGFCLDLLEDIAQCRRLRDGQNEIIAATTGAFARLYGGDHAALEPHVLRGEQSNTSIIFGDRLILKLFRRLDAGVNPDLEIGRFLTEKAGSIKVPALAGWIEYQAEGAETRTVAILQSFTANRGDAWTYTLGEMRQYMKRASSAGDAPDLPAASLVGLADSSHPLMRELAGSYLDAASLMGRRVAELHLALGADPDDPAFAPEPFSASDQRASYETMRDLQVRVFKSLADRMDTLNPRARANAQLVVANHNRISACFESFLACKVTVPKMRSHGDLHLGQMLYTGDDFVIIDFEGEPARPLSERRRKGICLRDVAGMLRSFDYAAMSVLAENAGDSGADGAGTMRRRWAELWIGWTSRAFLKAYMDRANDAPFIPRDRNELKIILDALLMEKAVYELGYELNNRPDWVAVPIQGIMRIIGIRESAAA